MRPSDRRFPLQRFVSADWTSPITNKLLLEASGIHRVERWGNMHLQTGKGENIDALAPGITGIVDNPSLATGASLNYRASSATFNNSWNWNLHYRVAASYITGSHNFKVGFNNAYLHHENTTYTEPGDGVQLQLRQRRAVAGRLPHSTNRRRRTSTTTWASSRRTAGPWVAGRWPGGVRFDAFKNHFPESSISPTFLAPNLNVSFPKIDNISWKDVTPKLGATYDLFGNGKTALKVTLNKYLEGMGTTGFGAAQVTDAPNPLNRSVRHRRAVPHPDVGRCQRQLRARLQPAELPGQRRVPRVDERGDLRHRRRGNQLRPGPAQRLGQAVLQLGVHDERAARTGAAPVAQRPVRAPAGTATSV